MIIGSPSRSMIHNHAKKKKKIWPISSHLEVTHLIFFLLTVQAKKGIAWHIDVCSPVRTVIDNGKLANQIARLVAIVIKFPFFLKTSLILTLSLFWFIGKG